jgi:hypothetical protein
VDQHPFHSGAQTQSLLIALGAFVIPPPGITT